MFEAVAGPGAQAKAMTDACLGWLDDDDQRRPDGAEEQDYAALGVKPRNGPLRSIEELTEIKGIDQRTYAQLAPAVTVFFGYSGGFSESTAQPLALAVMTGAGKIGRAHI